MRAAVRGTRILLASTLLAFAPGAALSDHSHEHPGETHGPEAVTSATPGSAANAPTANPSGAWDIEDARGATSEAKLDTRTGTWMSVDVSPDGKRLVFDLLGDLYLLPVTGGEAQPLTSGMAWDEQPRWSPDGRRIAFTSDRAGGSVSQLDRMPGIVKLGCQVLTLL